MEVDQIINLSILEMNILAHFGSFLAILIYYNKWVFRLLFSWRFLIRTDIDRNANLLMNLIISSVPIFFIGYFFAEYFDFQDFFVMKVIGFSSIIFGIILFFTDKFCLRVRNLETLTRSTCLFIGLSQCLALIPGVSRSGAILSFMRFNGFTREHSVFYSNLMSMPVIFGALTYLLINDYDNLLFDNFLNIFSISIVIFSFLFSFIFIHFFVSWVRKFSLLIFVIYRFIFGLAIIFLA